MSNSRIMNILNKKNIQSEYFEPAEIEIKNSKENINSSMETNSSETSNSEARSTSTLPAVTYTEGQEVIFGREKFFVLEDTNSTIMLLSKYCLHFFKFRIISVMLLYIAFIYFYDSITFCLSIYIVTTSIFYFFLHYHF